MREGAGEPSDDERRTRGPLILGDPVVAASWLGGAILLEHRHWTSRGEEFSPVRSTHARVTLTEAGRTERTLVRLDGRTAYDGADRPGALSFVPAFTERQYSYRGADLTYTGLWIDSAYANTIVAPEALDVAPIINGSDRLVRALLSDLRADVQSSRQPSTLYAEHLVAVVLLRLARRPLIGKGGRPARPLDAKGVERVREYIHGHLAADLSVRSLAVLVNLPVDHFARAFRAATGRGPYAYVLEQRVARAQGLLLGSRLPLAEIAHTVGFSSQSHFTSVFRKLTGLTPNAYRSAPSLTGE